MSTFYKYSITCLLLCISALLPAQTLDDYLKEGAENNPGLKAKYAEFEAAMQRTAQVSALPDPQLSFGYFISPVETRVGPQRAKFGLTQMFPWFGSLSAKGEMTALMAEAKYQTFLNARNEFFFKVKEAWYPLYKVNRMIVLQRENEALLRSLKELAITSFGNDKGSMVDVLRVDIMIEEIETDIRLLEDQKVPLLMRFNTLLNRADTATVAVPDSLSLIEVTSGYRRDSLLSKNPALEAFDLKMQSAHQQEKVAQKMGMPGFGVGVDYVIVGKGPMNVAQNGKDVLMPMVSMSLPIFRGKYTAAVQEAKFTQSAIASSKEEYENQLRSSYEMAWYELEKSRQLIELYHRQIEKSEQTLTLLLTSYSNSGKNFEEVLRMQQSILKYQMAEASAITDYYVALAKLDYLTGKSE